MLHDRVKVKTDEAQILYRMLGLADGDFTLGGFHRTPALYDPLRVTLPHAVHIVIGARRRRYRGFQIQGNQTGVHTGTREFSDHLFFRFSHPFTFPVSGQRLGVRALRINPSLCARVAMQINDAHSVSCVFESSCLFRLKFGGDHFNQCFFRHLAKCRDR